MTARFPGWICPPEEKGRFRPASPAPDVHTEALGADGLWNVWNESGDGGPEGSYSHEMLGRDGEREKYIIPTLTVETHEAVSSPAVVGEEVYFLSALSSMHLYVWNRKAGTVASVPEMDTALMWYKPDKDATYRLLSDGNALWIGTGWAVLRYQVKTKQVDVWEGERRQNGNGAYPYALLSVAGGKAWIKEAPDRLLIAGDSIPPGRKAPAPQTSFLPDPKPMVPVELPRLPAGGEPEQAKATLLAEADGIVWFQMETASRPPHAFLLGCRMQSGTWTKPHPGQVAVSPVTHTAHIVKQGAIQWFYGPAGSLGYHTETGRWQTLPPLPGKRQTSSPDLIPALTSVDERNAWAFSGSHLLHLDRTWGRWIGEEMPFEAFPQQASPAVRAGNTLLTPTETGLWGIDLATHRITRAPALRNSVKRDYYPVAADSNAVWLVGVHGGDGAVVRFDRKAHTWDVIPAQDDVAAPRYQRAQWCADGVSCWMQTSHDTYHLDSKTHRWENVSARLAGRQGKPNFQQIVADGDDVWLVTAKRESPDSRLSPPAIPLYRYHIKTDTFVPVQPAPGRSLLPHLLTVNRDSVLLTTSAGNFRFDRATQQWKPFSSPVLPVGLPLLKTLTVYEEAGDYWFVGIDSSLYLKPEAP